MSGRFVRTRVRLAQNFFAGDAPARRLVATAALSPGDRVYDLGAGTGRVTAALVAAGAQVIAVERDPNLARKLRERFGAKDVRVIEGDLTEVCFAAPFKVVANAPFNQTAVLLRRLLFEEAGCQGAVLVLQREAAQRYAGVRASALSLMAQPWFELGVSSPFGRHDFVPAPSVEVAVLHVSRRAASLLDPACAADWRAFVRAAFARARPDARRTFRPVLSNLQWRRLSADLGIRPGTPCTDLSLAQWVGAYHFVAACTPVWKRLGFLETKRTAADGKSRRSDGGI